MLRRNFLSFCSILPFFGGFGQSRREPKKSPKFKLVIAHQGEIHVCPVVAPTGQFITTFGTRAIHSRKRHILAKYASPKELRHVKLRDELAAHCDEWLRSLTLKPGDVIQVYTEWSKLENGKIVDTETREAAYICIE